MRGMRAAAAVFCLGFVLSPFACADAGGGPEGASGEFEGAASEVDEFEAEGEGAFVGGEKQVWVNPARCYPGCGTAPADLVAVNAQGAAAPAGAFRVRAVAQGPLEALLAAAGAAGQAAAIV